jgi:hypothetical protein
LWMISNIRKLKTKTLVNERFAFWCKGWIFKKLIQRTEWCKCWEQFKSMVNKKNCHILQQFQFLAHLRMCAQSLFMWLPIRLHRVGDKSTNTLQFQIGYKILSK